MTELTPEETAAYLARPTRWHLIQNWWKNLSRFWSPRERRLQRNLNAMHTEIGDSLTKFGE